MNYGFIKINGKSFNDLKDGRRMDRLTKGQLQFMFNEIKLQKQGFGFKQQTAVDDNGIVLGIHTVPANEYDSKGLEPLLDKLDTKYAHQGIYADKGYKVPNNEKLLKERNIKNRIMHKAYRNTPLSLWQDRFNRLISKSRWVVERTFGSVKKWLGGYQTRYVGLAKTHT